MTARRYDYDKDDPSFLADLHTSQSATWKVAQWLSAKGRHVTVRAVRVRPTVEQMSEFADEGDIELIERIEVKHRSIEFTNREDYPYPTVIVDVAHVWDRASPKPRAYVILNRAGDVAAIVTRESAGQWQRRTRLDRGKHRDRTFYECPVNLVTFVRL